MKPDTIAKIREFLKNEVEATKNRLLTTIECNYGTAGVEARVAEYRAAFRALEDFENWENKQEGDES
jgi:hypothetical protein